MTDEKKKGRRKARAWRYSRDTGYHYWEDDRLGYGYVFASSAGAYWANTARRSAMFDLLRDAKAFVEKHS